MTVAILIVNWNGRAYLRSCLASAFDQSRPADLIVLVDNASTDDSLDTIADFLPRVHLIRLSVNVGFARANNIAAAAAAAAGVELLALLNPDAFADPDWLNELVRAAARHPQSAAFASQIRFAHPPDRLDGTGDAYHVSGRAWRQEHGQPLPAAGGERDVFAACAAAALYRRQPFEAIGGFDERYFCYFEDVDLGFRLRLRGHRCVYVPSAVVAHISSGLSGYRSDFAVYHGERNMVWTFVKDMPARLLWRYLPQHLLLNAAALLYYPWRGQGRVVWRAKRDALLGLPAMWRSRRQVQRGLAVVPADLARSMADGLLTPYTRRYSTSVVP